MSCQQVSLVEVIDTNTLEPAAILEELYDDFRVSKNNKQKTSMILKFILNYG